MAKKGTERAERSIYSFINSILTGDDLGAGKATKLSIKDLLSSLAQWGGKSKDDLINILCREIGVAIATVLKEPINQIIEARKLQITLELVPKNGDIAKATSSKKRRQP